MKRIERFFTTWRFPSFMLFTLALFWVLMMVMAFMPAGDSAWGAFAEDFRVWCFGYDPESGSMQSIYLITYTVNPIILALIISWVWYEPLKTVWMKPFLAKGYAAASFALVGAIALTFPLMADAPDEEEFEFRADVLRISQTPPPIELINEHEKLVRLEDFRGRVVLLTSVYASCSDTCPMILDQAKRVLDRLSPDELEQVVLLAVTMHPEKDTPDLLRRISEFYRLDNYKSHMLTGDPDEVHQVLDRLGVARAQNMDTGEIDHANLFYLVDREGEIAFRFTLGERQEEWMTKALRTLIEEERPENLSEQRTDG